MADEYYSTAQAAEVLGVTPAMVRYWCRRAMEDGEDVGFRVSRIGGRYVIERSSLDAFAVTYEPGREGRPPGTDTDDEYMPAGDAA